MTREALMVIWTLAKKDLRLLLRDPRAVIILLAMPLIFILVLGMSLGDNFGQKSAAGLKVSVINPFHRDGVNLAALDVEVLRDPTQQTAAAIIDQVAQGSLLRVVLPWMIGRAFEKIGDPAFLDLLEKEKQVPGSIKLYLRFASA